MGKRTTYKLVACQLFTILICLVFVNAYAGGLDAPHTGAVGCTSCHQMTSTYPKLLPPLNHTPVSGDIDDTTSNGLCWSCHNDPTQSSECGDCHPNQTHPSAPYVLTHSSMTTDNGYGYWTVECWVCHNPHMQEQKYNGSTYGQYIRRSINLADIKYYDGIGDPLPEKPGTKSVVFKGRTGSASFADGDAIYNGICEVCHTQTKHFQNNGTAPNQLHSMDPNGKPAKIGAGIDCTICHKHVNGFAAIMPSHSASPGSAPVMVVDKTHDDVMKKDGMVEAECQMCHNTELSAAHDFQCLLCHPSPAGTLAGPWGGSCQQGGCHAVIHADANAAHNTVEDCSKCHGLNHLTPTKEVCPNCHAVYNPADTSKPVTTSNAKAAYLGPARIEYTVRDNGKVVVAQSYSRVDGGPAATGSSIIVTEPGNRTLVFWSVDQANNIESPTNEVTFAISPDTTPPVTTSNAQPINYGCANISLSGSDDGDLGVKTTYYSFDRGTTTKTGTSVFLCNPNDSPGTFNYQLTFWSEDWSGNVENSSEADNTVFFSIASGEGTFRMWGGGSSCANDPNADAYWIIKRNDDEAILAEGSDGCDKKFLVGATEYFIMEKWWVETTPGNGYWDQAIYGTYSLTTHGEVIELN